MEKQWLTLECRDSKGDIVTNAFHFNGLDLLNIGSWLMRVPDLDVSYFTIHEDDGTLFADSRDLV